MLQPRESMVDRIGDAFRKRLLKAVLEETMKMTQAHNKKIEE
jgi:hypothetical protein